MSKPQGDIRFTTLAPLSGPRLGDQIRRPQDTTTWQVIHVTTRWLYVYDVNDPDDVSEFPRGGRYTIC